MLQHQERSPAMHMDRPPFILATDKVPGVQGKQLTGAVLVYVCIYGFESVQNELFNDVGD